MKIEIWKNEKKFKNMFIPFVEKRHDVAITVMGNFLEHLQQNKSLREVDPSQVRIHTFGNPFKLKQQDQQDQVFKYYTQEVVVF